MIKTILLNIVIAVIYIVSGKLGLSLAFDNPSATVIWPPTGLALAAMLIFGYRVVPAIFIGAFFVNFTTAGTIATSLGIALGNTFEGVVGAYLAKKFANGIHAFDTVSDIFKFTFFAAILSTTISANIGTLTLILGGLASWSTFGSVWVTWWLGDMGGSLIVAPLLLVWAANRRVHIGYKKAVQFVLSIGVIFIITEVIFSGMVPYPYLYIPIAVWAAFAFGQRGAAMATAIVAGLTIYYTLSGIGPFVRESLNQSLIQLQLFLNTFSLTALTFAATVLAIRKSEKTLASHEQRFQSLIEKSSDGVVLIDASSKIIYASPSNKQVLGYAPEELEGKIGFDLIAPEDRAMTMRKLAELVVKPGGTITVEYRVLRKDKKMIWVEATGTNLLLDTDVNAVVVNFHDITEEKIAVESLVEEKLEDEAMLTSIGEGIIATDDKGNITVINQAACEILGWQEKELLGKSLVKAIPMEDNTGRHIPIAERPISKVFSHGKIVVSKTNYYVTKDKTKVPIRFTVTPITLEGSIVGSIEVFQDITKEKELDRMKNEFISMTSHELRTPMTAVNGLLSMILHGDYGPVNDGLKKPLNNIHISAQRQIQLINDLLDVSRLQTGRIDFVLTNFAINDVLDESVKSLQPLVEQKGIALVIKNEEQVSVQADSEWTKHILNNLIGNALKFTEKGSIVISYAKDHDSLLISISDTGAGIDPSDHKKLFGRFQQLSSKTISQRGSGLGLYLTRELARKMGGDVWLEKSVIGKGSIFIFSLPIAQTALAKKAKGELSRAVKLQSQKKQDRMELFS